MPLKNLTAEQRRALSYVWDQIAGDVLVDESDILSQADVIELVLDADRPYTFCPEVDWSDFILLTYAEKIEAAKQVFTYEEYIY